MLVSVDVLITGNYV